MTKTKPQRVAIVYHFFAHYRKSVFEELIHHGRHEYVFCGDQVDPDNGSIEAWIPDPPTEFRLAKFRRILGPIAWQRVVHRLALRRDIDSIIYLGDPHYLTTWTSAFLARIFGKNVFFWSHGVRKKEKGIRRLIRRTFFRLPHTSLLYGHDGKRNLKALGVATDSMHVVYNCHNYEGYKTQRERYRDEELALARSKLFDDPSAPMLICSVRLKASRRFDLLLEAMRLLKVQGVTTNLLLIGDGPIREELEQTAKQDGLPVNFYGACYDEDAVSKLTQAARLTVLPSALGLTAIQSLSLGTPVIASNDTVLNGPEMEAITPGVTGDFFKPGDAKDLARVIRSWLETKPESEHLRGKCYEIIDQYYNPSYQRYAIERAIDGDLPLSNERNAYE